jgi:hypothetical protein
LLVAGADECGSAYEALEYRSAVELCRAAIPTVPREALAGVYRTLALSLSALDEQKQSESVYASLLALDPGFQLDPSISPKLLAPFERTREAGAAMAASLRARPLSTPHIGKPLSLRVTIDDSPLRPVTEVRVIGEGKSISSPRTADTLDVTLPSPAHVGGVAVDLRGFDAFGGELTATHASFEIEQPHSLWRDWKLWAGGAVAVGLAGLVAGIYSSQSFDAARSEPRAKLAMDDVNNGRTAAYVADSAFAGAVVFAGIAAVMLLIPER